MRYRINGEDIKKNYGAEILLRRGIKDVGEFLNPHEYCLQNPYHLDNIKEGAQMLISKLTDDAKLAIIVDCDVDGFTSSSIIYNYLKKIKDIQIDYYIHSGKQHGLEDMVDRFLDKGKYYDLLIIPDAGSNDFEYVEQLKEIELPVLIIDHHIVEDDTKISDNCILINNQESWNYMNKDLSGAGLAYQFCKVLDNELNLSYADQFIDLAALGVCADMMSGLEIENQFLWHKGFSNINNFFFETLCNKQAFSMGNKVTPMTVAFYIVPMINAMIRVGTMDEKDRLFQAFTDGLKKVPSNKRGAKGTMELVAVESARECTNAKNHQDKKKKEVAENLDIKIHKNGLLDNKILFVRLDEDDEFPAVLNGLVCMELSKKYNRPTIVARINDEGFIRGSARGVNGSELESFKEFLNKTGYFDYTVGHDNAFGISIHNDKLSKFHSYANAALQDMDFGENIYDVDIERSGNSKDIADIVLDLAKYNFCWSQQNNTPLIAVNNIFIKKEDVQIMGKNKDTVKFKKNDIEYIKFFAKDLIEQLNEFEDMKINLIGEAQINEWNSQETPQILIKDLEVFNAAYEF